MTKSVIVNRNSRIDFYKAVLMFSVVWGHTNNILLNGASCECNISWFLRSFDMPMFMFLSGFFLKYSVRRYHIKPLLLNKTSYILFPALFWSLLVSAGHKPHTLYFLWAVYLSTVCVILVETLSYRYLKPILYAGLILMLHVVNMDFVNMSYLFPFFLIGYYWKSLETNKLTWWAVFIYVFLICFWNTDYTIWKAGAYIMENPVHMIKVVLLRFSIGLAGIFAMKLFFDVLYSYLKPIMFDSDGRHFNVGGVVLKIGRETLGLYIFQAIATYGIMKLFVKWVIKQVNFNPFMWNERLLIYVIAPLLSVIILLISLYIIDLLKSNRYTSKLLGFKICD